ncbi:MAG: hypothetical protein DRJ37_02695 [Thermoprotei archaeon]|nr:MAG: hypothetical protein DRJ37_02695 [Thermoprotei archaeon]
MRVSGHYHPYQLKRIIETLNPKRVRVIHTEKPETSQRMAEQYLKM